MGTHAIAITHRTTVLMGYRHDRFTRAPGVANASEASWQLLGNTIQREVLASLCAPFLDGLVERRSEMIREMMSHRARKAR